MAGVNRWFLKTNISFREFDSYWESRYGVAKYALIELNIYYM